MSQWQSDLFENKIVLLHIRGPTPIAIKSASMDFDKRHI